MRPVPWVIADELDQRETRETKALRERREAMDVEVTMDKMENKETKSVIETIQIQSLVCKQLFDDRVTQVLMEWTVLRVPR